MSGGVNDFTPTLRSFMLVVLFLTPLQAAAEEYAFRGYLLQAFGGLFRSPYLAVAASSLLPRAPSSPASSVSIGSVADGSEERRREKSQAKIQERKFRRIRTQGKISGKKITCTRICGRGLNRRRITGADPCRRTVPCRGVLPCRRALPCRGLLPWRRSRSRWHFGGGFRALLVRLFCSCTSQQARYQQMKKHSSTPGSRRLNY